MDDSYFEYATLSEDVDFQYSEQVSVFYDEEVVDAADEEDEILFDCLC